MGPFIGSKPEVDAPSRKNVAHGAWAKVTNEPCGSPRSHARLSKLPKMWQVAHAVSPCPDVRVPSYRNLRPALITSGLGSNAAGPETPMAAISLSLAVSTVEMVLLKRF